MRQLTEAEAEAIRQKFMSGAPATRITILSNDDTVLTRLLAFEDDTLTPEEDERRREIMQGVLDGKYKVVAYRWTVSEDIPNHLHAGDTVYINPKDVQVVVADA